MSAYAVVVLAASAVLFALGVARLVRAGLGVIEIIVTLLAGVAAVTLAARALAEVVERNVVDTDA